MDGITGERSREDTAGAVPEQEEESEREWTVRSRRNRETRAELQRLVTLEKVKHCLLVVSNKLERTQLQKMRDGPLRRMIVKQKLSLKRQKEQRRHHHERRSSSERQKKKQHSWVVGQFGEEGVKDRREGDEEELKHLRSMGVVKRRLKEKDKVRQQAVTFFKHRYELDPDSTQKSNCILVTGYEEGAGQTAAAELIRQQSTVVISNFFNQPMATPTVLSRLPSSSWEQDTGSVGAREHRHTVSAPCTVPLISPGASLQGARGQNSLRGSEELEQGDLDDDLIPKAMSISQTHSRTVSAPLALPSLTTPTATPSPFVDTSFPSSGVIVADCCEDFNQSNDMSDQLTTPPEKQATPSKDPVPHHMINTGDRAGVTMTRMTSSHPPLVRSTSYIAAMETEDIIDTSAKGTNTNTPKRVQSAKSSKDKLTRKVKKSIRLLIGRSKLSENKSPSTKFSDFINEGEEPTNSSDVTSSEVIMTSSEDVEGSSDLEDSPKHKPHPLPPPPLPACPPKHHLSPKFSVTSLPGHDPKPSKYYTALSPRIAKVTENPFAKDFDRAMRKKNTTPVARSNTTLPDDIINDEGFKEFLTLQNAKPTKSLYIAYQIMMISQQIDTKYGKHLNQALDDIIHEVIDNNLTWENFSIVARQLMFKGEGFKDGLFMVPAFGRRLLGFLPGMRDVITTYTQAVIDEYAMDWLLMRGGWGELLCHYDQEETREGRGGTREEKGEGEGEGEGWSMDSDEVWMWCAEGNGDLDEPATVGGEGDEVYDTAMGYGLISPEPESQDHSLTTPVGMDISDVGFVVEQQVSIHDDEPCPMTTDSELFLASIYDMAPPIGRGLRRVISVEVLFSTPAEDGCQGTAEMVSMRSSSLSRVSSLPSMSSSIPSPTTPVSIPYHRNHPSTSSSGIGMSPSSSPLVFTLPSMRPHPLSHDKPRPPSSVSSEYRRHSSIDSSIHIISSVGMSPPATSSSPRTRYSCWVESARRHWSRDSSGLLSMTTSSNGCGQSQATPTKNGKEAAPLLIDVNSSETPPTNHHQNIPRSHDQATPPSNNGGLPLILPSSSDSYADYGLELGNGSTTEWEWNYKLLATAAVVVGIGLTLAYWKFRK